MWGILRPSPQSLQASCGQDGGSRWAPALPVHKPECYWRQGPGLAQRLETGDQSCVEEPLSAGLPRWVHLEGSRSILSRVGLPPMTAGNFLGSPQQSPLPGWRWKTWGPGHWGSRPLSFSRVWDQRRPLPTLTVHPDHSFQGADGVEVGFLFPAFF